MSLSITLATILHAHLMNANLMTLHTFQQLLYSPWRFIISHILICTIVTCILDTKKYKAFQTSSSIKLKAFRGEN